MLRAIAWKALFSSVGIWIVPLFISVPALAVPLSYSEALAGDITFPAPAFALDVGTNTVAGTTHFDVNRPGAPRFDVDFDSFAFTVPSGAQLSGIALSFVTTTFNARRANLELRLCREVSVCGLDPGELLGSDFADLLGASRPVVDFGLAFPLLAGTYSLFVSGIGIAVADLGVPQASWSADYAWALSVQSVPEPTVLWLLALGLAGMATVRRVA